MQKLKAIAKYAIKLLGLAVVGLTLGATIMYADDVKKWYYDKTAKTYQVVFETPRSKGAILVTQKRTNQPNITNIVDSIKAEIRKQYKLSATTTIPTPIVTQIIEVEK